MPIIERGRLYRRMKFVSFAAPGRNIAKLGLNFDSKALRQEREVYHVERERWRGRAKFVGGFTALFDTRRLNLQLFFQVSTRDTQHNH